MARSLLLLLREQPYTCVRSIVINVSFNELALGSDLPTQRPAPSRPAEASTFATMMDEADARLSANDRASETRANVDTRDTGRADRPAAAEQPSSRDSTDAPAADAGARTTAPADSDKTATVRTDKTTTDASQDTAAAPRDTTTETATAPATTENTGETTSADITEQPAPPVAAPQDTAAQTPADDAAANAAQIIIPVPTAVLVQAPTQPATIAPTFTPATATAPISAPQMAAPVPQNNDSQPAQPLPQAAASQPAMPQTAPASASNPDDAALFAALTATAPAPSPATPTSTTPAATPAATNIPAPIAASVTSNAASSKPADKAGNLTAATLFAATALSQPVADSDHPPQLPVTPQATPATDTKPPSATSQTATPIVPQPNTTASAPTKATETPAPVDPTLRQANTAPATQPATSNAAPSTAAAPVPMTTATLAALIGSANIDITIDQAAAPAPLKPAPALANGMVAQFANAQSGETKTSTPTSLFGGVDGSATTQTAVPPQTAMAVAAAPVAQDVADDAKPKLAADGLVINAPAPTPGSHALHTAATDAASIASKPTVPNQPVFDQVAVHVAKAAAEGLDKINIKLKPISLGQIEVQLEVATDGRVHAVIAADKPETLDLLQRDARSLERALGDAGLRTDSGSLSFNLRGQNQQQFGGNSNFAGFGGAERASNDIALPVIDNSMRLGAYLNARAAAGGVDIRV